MWSDKESLIDSNTADSAMLITSAILFRSRLLAGVRHSEAVYDTLKRLQPTRSRCTLPAINKRPTSIIAVSCVPAAVCCHQDVRIAATPTSPVCVDCKYCALITVQASQHLRCFKLAQVIESLMELLVSVRHYNPRVLGMDDDGQTDQV